MKENGAAERSVGYTPVLGLFDEPGERPPMLARAGTVFDQPEPEDLMELMRRIAWERALSRW